MSNKLKRWLKSSDAFELGAIVFIIVGIILVVLALGLGVKTKINLEGGDSWSNITQYSEFIAGLIGGIWSLAGVLLFYSSLSSQKADLEAQKDLLVKQIDEVVAQTKEFRIQNEMAKDQKNEETFFQLLRFHNEIITSIELEQNDMDFSTGENVTKIIDGRKAFVEYYDIFKRFFGESSEYIQPNNRENLAKLFDRCYSTFYLEYQADLGHYFRNLYNLLKYIKTVKKEIQPFFLSLLIAQLSNYELTLLFFHCLRHVNEGFKELVEEFSILAQVPKDEVTSMAYDLYDEKAFGDDGFGSGDVLDVEDDGEIDENSLLGQLNKTNSEEGDNKKHTSKDFMDDLLSRLKGAEEGTASNDYEKEPEIEIEGEDFLDSFFDRQEKEKEKKRSNLLVEKEKVQEKEREILDLDDIIKDNKDIENEDIDEDTAQDLIKNTMFVEDSSNYDSSELANLKSQFNFGSGSQQTPPKKEENEDNEDSGLDLSAFFDTPSNPEPSEEPKEMEQEVKDDVPDFSSFMDLKEDTEEIQESSLEQDKDEHPDFSDFEDKDEDDKINLSDFKLDLDSSSKDIDSQEVNSEDDESKPASADDLLDSLKSKFGDSDSKQDTSKSEQNSSSSNDVIEDSDSNQLSKDRDASNPKKNDENDDNNNIVRKSKKKVKIKPRSDDSKPKGGSGFLSKL